MTSPDMHPNDAYNLALMGKIIAKYGSAPVFNGEAERSLLKSGLIEFHHDNGGVHFFVLTDAGRAVVGVAP